MTDKDNGENKPITSTKEIEEQGRILGENEEAFLQNISNGSWTQYARVGMAALSGINWIGSISGAISAMSAEVDQNKTNHLIYFWVKEHELKLLALTQTIERIFHRFDSFGERISERINSEEYLSLVRQSFKAWDEVETNEKREMLRRLITNAGGIEINQDDWVRMYVEWISKYNDFHFHVIREIYENSDITRYQIWLNLRGEIPNEDSAEADLFKLLIRDLSTGGVIRQSYTSRTKGKSAFDDTDTYVLTELGSQFVIYVMTETAIQIEGETE